MASESAQKLEEGVGAEETQAEEQDRESLTKDAVILPSRNPFNPEGEPMPASTIQQSTPVPRAAKLVPSVQPSAELQQARMTRAAHLQQPADSAALPRSETKPSASAEPVTPKTVLASSASCPAITLTRAAASSNEDFRLWTLCATDLRSETGEVRSGLVVPVARKFLRRELRRDRVVVPMPATPTLCRRTDSDDDSVSDLDLDERLVEVTEPVEEFRSKDWASGGEWVIHDAGDFAPVAQCEEFRSKDWARGGEWQIHYKRDDSASEQESNALAGGGKRSNMEELRDYVRRKACALRHRAA
ncbi:hypothetical protein LTR85_007918 [Meristemomyces frigidus]|nr:hypothetical protein LTR85_007918 [Meristemomyces frigidus]